MAASPRLVVRDLAFSFSDALTVLDHVELVLTTGWSAVVGANGAGKSTLLRLLAGRLRPQEGSIRCEPPTLAVALGEQTVDAPPEGASVLLETADGPRLASTLAIEPGDLGRWPTLSPGERRRWQIAVLLAARPDVLLLDEPTNHLDADGRAALLRALRGFSGIGVVVTHDRELARALEATTIRVDRGGVRHWALPYEEARAAWEAEVARAVGERAQWRAGVARRAKALDEAQRERAAADRARSSRVRMRDRNDHDGRGALAKGMAARAEAKAGRIVAVRREELERAQAREPEGVASKELGRSVFLRWSRSPGPHIAHLETEQLRAGSRVLAHDVRLTWSRDDRIHLAGPNGVGKSTLLRALLAANRSATVAYVPQELDEAARAGLLATVRTSPREERGRTLSLVAALGADPDRILASRDLSPGEARKLALAEAMGRLAHALALDEPTHHLDLPSIERLEVALSAWPGPLVLVTHDAELANRVTTLRWELSPSPG